MIRKSIEHQRKDTDNRLASAYYGYGNEDQDARTLKLRQESYEDYISTTRTPTETKDFELQCRIDQASQDNKISGIRELAVDKRIEQIVEDMRDADSKRGESEQEFKESLWGEQQNDLYYRREAQKIAMKELEQAMSEGRI